MLILLINFNSCTAQKNNTKMNDKIIIPEITKEFEKFDIANYDSKNENSFIKEDNFLVKRMSQSFGFGKHIVIENSYFSITKLYYKNKNIKEKGISFNNGSEYGIWYEFNQEGKLIKEINSDDGYDFGWEKIIAYCEEKEIPLTKGFKEFDGFQTSVYKREEENKKLWIISFLLPVGDKIMEITLDGKTGKEIKQKEIDFIGG